MLHARRTTAVIGGLLTTGALVLSTPGLADAAAPVPTQRTTSNSEKHTSNGDGDADARANANRNGKLSVGGEVRGGGTDSGLPGNEDTTARARAKVTKRVSAADGTYRISVKYNDARGIDRDRKAADADVNLLSTVTFSGPGGQSGPTLRRENELSPGGRDRTSNFTYKVPNGQSGRLIVDAGLRGHASAPSQGDTGRFSGGVSGVKITVKRIGG